MFSLPRNISSKISHVQFLNPVKMSLALRDKAMSTILPLNSCLLIDLFRPKLFHNFSANRVFSANQNPLK